MALRNSFSSASQSCITLSWVIERGTLAAKVKPAGVRRSQFFTMAGEGVR